MVFKANLINDTLCAQEKSTRVHTLIDTHVHTSLHTTLKKNASHSETKGLRREGNKWIGKGEKEIGWNKFLEIS